MKIADILVGKTYRRELASGRVTLRQVTLIQRRNLSAGHPLDRIVFYQPGTGTCDCFRNSFARWADSEADPREALPYP